MKSKTEKADANEFGEMRSLLARAGVSQATIKRITDKDKTREENTNALREYFKGLTHG